jgi:hypothetical protein
MHLKVADRSPRPAFPSFPRKRESMCATHDTGLGGASPLRAARSGTASQRQQRPSHAGLGGSRRQNGEPANRNRIRGQRWGNRAWDGEARYSFCHPQLVDPAATPGKCSVLRWETSPVLRANGSRVQATAFEGRGGVSRGHRIWTRSSKAAATGSAVMPTTAISMCGRRRQGNGSWPR